MNPMRAWLRRYYHYYIIVLKDCTCNLSVSGLINQWVNGSKVAIIPWYLVRIHTPISIS